MKKTLIIVLSVLLAVLMLSCLTACDMLDGIFGKKSGVNKEYYENCAVFTFDNFDSKIGFTLERTALGDDAIYYQVNLDKGMLSVKYSDVGLENQLLSEFTADDEMPINGSGGYVEGDKVDITFEAFSPVSGEIIIAFTEDALKAVHKDKILHEHTIEWETTDEAHKRIYTCDCNLTNGDFEPHYDDDNNGYCDECEYFSGIVHTEHTGEWYSNENCHFYQYTCGCETPDIAQLHFDYDSDLLCDACGYELINTNPIFPDGEIISIIEYEPWLNEITAEDVNEIKTISCAGVSYEELRTIISTSNKDIISTMISDLKQVTIEHNDLVEYDIPAGSLQVEVYLNDGSVKRIIFNGGGHFYNGNPVNKAPHLDRESFIDISKSFSFVSYGRFTDIYYRDIYSSLANGFKIGRINPEMIEFTECSCVGFDDVERRYYYYFDTEFGGVSIYDGVHFMLDGTLYEIVNSSHVDLSAVQTIKTARENKFNDGRVAFVEAYYGSFESGAIVAMVSDDKTAYTEALWSESIAGYAFRYYDGNRIVILYDGEFYSLPEAYENGYLTESDIYTVWKLHS